jgi:hypothetical protein
MRGSIYSSFNLQKMQGVPKHALHFTFTRNHPPQSSPEVIRRNHLPKSSMAEPVLSVITCDTEYSRRRIRLSFTSVGSAGAAQLISASFLAFLSRVRTDRRLIPSHRAISSVVAFRA